jgi:SAM-dependent methyltransferase
MTSPTAIFDTALARHRLARARATGAPADFLLACVAEDLAERLATIKRTFLRIADVGTPGPHLAAMLAARDPAATVVRVAPLAWAPCAPGSIEVVGSGEALPLAEGRFDLVVSALALQGANDLPGALVQIRRALVADGLFLGAIVGGQTLHELRSVLTEAEAEITGGASPRVAPFADVRDMGGLLQRAGFALPVADAEALTVRYDNLFALMADLRAMGATSTLVARDRRPARRAMFLRAAELYAARFADADGRIRATFEIVSLAGWAPHERQQKPARRGSGTVSLADALRDRTDRLL